MLCKMVLQEFFSKYFERFIRDVIIIIIKIKKKKKRTFHVITPIDTRIPTYLRNETINRHHTRLGYHRENPKNSFINCYHAQIKCTITRHVEKLAGHRTN